MTKLKPFLNDKVELGADDEEIDDAMYEAASLEGLTPAVEDLSVLDFFAAISLIALNTTGGTQDLARRAYEVAGAMVLERARVEDERALEDKES